MSPPIHSRQREQLIQTAIEGPFLCGTRLRTPSNLPVLHSEIVRLCTLLQVSCRCGLAVCRWDGDQRVQRRERVLWYASD